MSTASPEEIRRTEPDLIVHDPTGGVRREWNDPDFFWLNEQIIVVRTSDGGLLATWTAQRLDPHLLRIACSRSEDEGRTWSAAQYLDGDGIDDGGAAAWQVPVIALSGRIYLFYTHSRVPKQGPFCGGLRCCVSDDGGRSWSTPEDHTFPRSPVDNPDIHQPSIWISVSVPTMTRDGNALLGFTRWANNADFPCGTGGIKERYSHIEFLRFENLPENPDPSDVRLNALNVQDPIRVPHEEHPDASFAQEPYTVPLPDGRLFMVMRTNRGEVWYAVSENAGVNWSQPQPMLDHDGGKPMRHPVAPCPVFALSSGDYLFLFHNNNGYVFGAESPWDVRNRRPTFVSSGQYRDSKQPIWWGRPQPLIDNDGIPWGPDGKGRLEAAAYPSLTKTQGGHVLWYPDRKGFLLGKYLRDEWVSGLDAPQAAANNPMQATPNGAPDG